MNYLENYEKWLGNEDLDPVLKEELEAIKGNDNEIKWRFIQSLSFGTAGLRGTMNAGTNAMNVYTVRQASQGLAELILKEGGADRGVVIGRDSRNNSELFAKVSAEVFAANGIRTYFLDELRPVPVLSFSIRHLNCIAGVNITASHNPKEYNGYKAYWEDGAQLAPEQAEVVSSFIGKTDIFAGAKTVDFDEAVKEGKIEVVGTEIDDEYLKNVTDQLVDKEVIRTVADDLKIVYTPLHGAGYRLVPEALRLSGVKHLYTVRQQMILDGNFPTVASPNPENAEGFAIGKVLADKVGSDLLIATDPDCDRVGIMARNKDGQFVTFTGNQVGALLSDYILTAYENTNTMPSEPYAVKTIVTSEMAARICREHNVEIFNVLTGFKYIGEVIKNHDDLGKGHYLLGFEESYGYLKGTYARDKDGVVAALLIVEMAAYYKKRGMTLCDALDELFVKYGYYREKTVNAYYKGLDGIEKMKQMMDRVRKNPPAKIAGKRVIETRDYESGVVTDITTGKTSSTNLPKSNVLYYKTEGENVVVIRPSGTEPKIKLYIMVNDTEKESADQLMADFSACVTDWTK